MNQCDGCALRYPIINGNHYKPGANVPYMSCAAAIYQQEVRPITTGELAGLAPPHPDSLGVRSWVMAMTRAWPAIEKAVAERASQAERIEVLERALYSLISAHEQTRSHEYRGAEIAEFVWDEAKAALTPLER